MEFKSRMDKDMQHISEITNKIRQEIVYNRVKDLIVNHDVDKMTAPELREKINQVVEEYLTKVTKK